MKSTWNRTCFPNPPGCFMIVSNTIRTGLAGHQRKPMSCLSSLRQLKLTSAYRIGPARVYLVYFTQSWRSLPSMFVFGTIEATPSIIRTRCINEMWVVISIISKMSSDVQRNRLCSSNREANESTNCDKKPRLTIRSDKTRVLAVSVGDLARLF